MSNWCFHVDSNTVIDSCVLSVNQKSSELITCVLGTEDAKINSSFHCPGACGLRRITAHRRGAPGVRLSNCTVTVVQQIPRTFHLSKLKLWVLARW